MKATRKPATPQIVPGTVPGAVMVKLGDQPGYDAEFYGYNARRNAQRLIAYPQLVVTLRALLHSDAQGDSILHVLLINSAVALLAKLEP